MKLGKEISNWLRLPLLVGILALSAFAQTVQTPPPQAPANTPVAAAEPTSASSQEERLPFRLSEREEAVPEPPSISGLFLRTIGALLLIVGLLAAAGWALRHFGIVNLSNKSDEAAGLKVLNTVSLGDRRSLTVVKFGERTLLIGSTAQGLTLLAEQEELEFQENQMPTMRTVNDLLEDGAQAPFEQEMTRATLLDERWNNGRTQS